MVVVPSVAVTLTVIGFAPTCSAMGSLAVPLATWDSTVSVCLPTVTLAAELVAVGVSFRCVAAFAADAA